MEYASAERVGIQVYGFELRIMTLLESGPQQGGPERVRTPVGGPIHSLLDSSILVFHIQSRAVFTLRVSVRVIVVVFVTKVFPKVVCRKMVQLCDSYPCEVRLWCSPRGPCRLGGQHSVDRRTTWLVSDFVSEPCSQ